jgi:tetratricopeptide (TPR) repeat protein
VEIKPVETKPAETRTDARDEAKPEPKPKPAPLEVKPAVSALPAIPGSRAIALNTHARQLVNDGHFEEAIQQFTEALKIDAAMPLAYNGRGYAHFRLKQYTEAIGDFDQAIKLNPAYENAYLNRGAARKAAGDKAGADADLAKAREISAH